MTRGRIQIRKIVNTTNRQVTFSKRKNGLFKKALKLTVLCDNKDSIMLLSSTDKRCQKTLRPDLWDTHYEYKSISSQTDTAKKKARSVEGTQKRLLYEYVSLIAGA